MLSVAAFRTMAPRTQKGRQRKSLFNGKVSSMAKPQRPFHVKAKKAKFVWWQRPSEDKGLAKAFDSKANKGPSSKGKAINLRGKGKDPWKASATTFQRQRRKPFEGKVWMARQYSFSRSYLLTTARVLDASGLEEVASVDYLCRTMLQNLSFQ
jgi:hypothetical protein